MPIEKTILSKKNENSQIKYLQTALNVRVSSSKNTDFPNITKETKTKPVFYLKNIKYL